MDKIFILFLCFYSGLASIKIKELKVPEPIENGSTYDVVLDCDFEAEGEKGIEVKWFLNGMVDQIYQWIPETNRSGQAIGKLKDNIDVSYKVSEDLDTMYRALHIVNVTLDMSGNYTCKVSSYLSEAVDTKEMIIYEKADDGLELDLDEDESTIFCSADGLYPEPNMTIYIMNDNGSEVIFFSDEEDVIRDEDTGLYNVTASLLYDAENMSTSYQYVCELTIPGTSYQEKLVKVHYIETNENNRTLVEDLENNIIDSDFFSTNASTFDDIKEKGENDTNSEGVDLIKEFPDPELRLKNNEEEENSSSNIGLPNILTLLVYLLPWTMRHFMNL